MTIAQKETTAQNDDTAATDADAITAAVESARSTFASGRTRPLAWRRRQLVALLDALADYLPDIREAMLADLGKNEVETQITEIQAVTGEAKLVLKNLERWTADRRVAAPLTSGRSAAFIRREPLGTVLVIGPWNYPFHLVFMPLIGAIAAGNSVVLKPSEVAPNCSRVVAEIVSNYLDNEAITVVEGGVEETSLLLQHAFDHIFYTGNGAVAKIVMAAAAEHLTPVTLELGGKSPVWIDGSFPLSEAAEAIAWGKFSNCGQTCVAPDYVLTTPDLVEPLARAVSEVTVRFYGDDPQSNPDYGRIVNERHTARLLRMLDSGRAVCGGGGDPADRYVAPTVLVDVSADDPVMAEEIFGPILPILSVPDHNAAVEFINSRPKPLALYAFTHDESVRDAILDGTSSGGVAINTVMLQLGVPELPFGGVGASGMGAYHGERSVTTFSHERGVLQRLGGPDPSRLVRPPFSGFKKRLLVR